MKVSIVAAWTFIAVSAAYAADQYASYDDHATAGMTRVAGQDYVNNNYGFSVKIPDGQVAWMNSAPSPNHGFRIFLGPERSIEVDASFDSAFLGSISAVADDAVGSLPSSDLSKLKDELGGKAAERVIVAGPGDRRRIVLASWVEAAKDEDVNYEVSLETTNKVFEHDAKIFDEIARSFDFKFVPPMPSSLKRALGGALLATPAISNYAVEKSKKDSTPPK